MSRYLAQSAAAVLVALLMGLSDSNLRWSIDHAQARANFQLPWPANVQHRITTGYTYGCGTHTGSLYYSLDFQFASNESIAAASGGVVIEKSDLGGSSYGKHQTRPWRRDYDSLWAYELLGECQRILARG